MINNGIVIKAVNGYYYVQCDAELICCKIRGRLKKERFSLVVGDKVEISQSSDATGTIDKILPRRSLLKRPAAANVDQVIIVFAATQPELNMYLLDKFLVLAELSQLDIVIAINKIELAGGAIKRALTARYESLGYRLIFLSALQNSGVTQLQELLTDKISVLAGPSGVGKSTLLNSLEPSLNVLTGLLSDKIRRGKHTTRLAQLFPLTNGGFIVDTPGFSLAEFNELAPSELAACFPEFTALTGNCKFSTCTHDHEPGCAVKQAVEAGAISAERYQSYLNILAEIKNNAKGVP